MAASPAGAVQSIVGAATNGPQPSGMQYVSEVRLRIKCRFRRSGSKHIEHFPVIAFAFQLVTWKLYILL